MELLGDTMKNHNKILLSLFAVVMLGIAIPNVAAQGNAMQYNHSAGIVTLSTDSLELKVVGANQFPDFHWWDPSDDSVDYHMRFISLFEANDTDADGVFTRSVDHVIGYRFMLPTIGWEFSGFETESVDDEVTAVHFNFTSTSEYDPRPGGPTGDYGHLPDLSATNVTVQIRVHLYMDNPHEVKFDVVIGGWTWTYTDSILVMQFTIVETNHGNGMPERSPGDFAKTGTKFNFNNAYMSYEDEALALQAQNSLQVKASYGEGVGNENGESVYLAFQNFGDDTLEYDPIVGLSADTLPLDSTTTLLLLGGVGIVAIVAIAMKIKK